MRSNRRPRDWAVGLWCLPRWIGAQGSLANVVDRPRHSEHMEGWMRWNVPTNISSNRSIFNIGQQYISSIKIDSSLILPEMLDCS